MAYKKTTRSKNLPAKAPANLLAVLAIVGLVILSVVDLLNTNDVPNYIYFGLIGASLGAKWDDVAGWFGGKK